MRPTPSQRNRASVEPRASTDRGAGVSRVRRRWFERFENASISAKERILLIILGYVIGGLGYLAVNHWIGEGPFHRLELPIDRWIPFVPVFVFGYVLVYFTPGLSAFFIADRAEIYRTSLAFGLNAVICFSIFAIFPVEYPRVFPVPEGLSGRILAFVHVLDRPVNCFPSHHIATSFTAYFAVRRQDRRWGAIFGIAAVLVAVSTLLVKQHYVVDVPGGIAVAGLTYVLSFPPRSTLRS